MHEALSRAAFEREIKCFDRRAADKWGWKIIAAEFPVFDVIFTHRVVEPLRLRLDCTDWDELPPPVELLNAAGTALSSLPPGLHGVFHPGPHPNTGRPFVCMRGTREYHTHFSHIHELWDNYRGRTGMGLLDIVLQIWRAWKKLVG